jgi:hypothetical protein
MGGLLARAEQWKHFEKQFSQLQADLGFKVWHTTKFKRKAAIFEVGPTKNATTSWALQRLPDPA